MSDEVINILGVDSVAENLDVLEHLLAGFNVCLTRACLEGQVFDSLARKEYALVLLAVDAEDIDSLELARQIHLSANTARLPILFLLPSEYSCQNHFFQSVSGPIDYLSRSLIPQLFKSKIEIYLQLFHQKKELESTSRLLQRADQRVAEQELILAGSERRFRTAFEQSYQFMAIMDVKGRVIELNHLAKKLCGSYAGVITGQYLWNVCWLGQDEENERLRKVIARAASGQCVADEARFVDITGRVYYFARSVSPVRDDKGDITCLAMQGHDITKRIEAEREQYNLQTLLQQAQKMEALGALAGGIAHDFNNILSVIIGNADLAGRCCPDDSPYQQYFYDIQAAGSQAKELVKQILSFSRQSDICKTLVEPAKIVHESMTLLRASIPTTIDIVHNIDMNCGAILADSTQIHQIVMNLCTNAFHAMEDNGGTLHLALYQERVEDGETGGFDCGAGEYAHLIVKDDGCGIDGDVGDKIYEPYFTTKEDGKGTGMGLSIVHGIVKAHGGAIRMESRKNVGTAFHVFFPLCVNRHSLAEVEAAKLPSGEERILLVDDEEQVRQTVKNMLEVIGYEVTTPESSPGAFELFQSNPTYFDLVITDQTMPQMTGLELAGRILQIRADLPVILCTGNSPGISRDMVVTTGIKELILKPFDLEQLSQVVRQTLDNPS